MRFSGFTDGGFLFISCDASLEGILSTELTVGFFLWDNSGKDILKIKI